MQIYYNKNIRILRKKAGLTQTELAERLNKNKESISAYERGSSEPPLTVFAKISNIFGVSLDDLYYKNMEAEDIQIVKVNFDQTDRIGTMTKKELKEMIIEVVQQMSSSK